MILSRHANTVLSPVSHDPDLLKRVLLRDGRIQPILQISEFTLQPGQQITPHVHQDATEVFYVVEGAVNFSVAEQSIQLSQGDLLVVEPGELHAVSGLPETPARFFYFLMLTS